MRSHSAIVGCLLAIASVASQIAAQDSTGVREPINVTVGGDVPHPFTITTATLASLPRRTVRAADHGQPEAAYEGVALMDILAQAGAPLGSALRGKAMATYVVVGATDGYRVVFALPELDSAFTDRVIILADQKNGHPLDDREGPARLIVPGEKRPARWERQVTSITVRNASE
jgi:DMSO/TMAO reductase YedYZ molybdopterin-dependent catalytic subunit